MARDWTTAGGLATLKRRAFLPDSGGPFTDAELLSISDEILQSVCFPAVMNAYEEYYVYTADVTPVANQEEYEIPDKSMAGILRDLTWLDSNGNGISIPWVPLEHRDELANNSYVFDQIPRFTIQGDRIVLLPAPSSSNGTLRVRFIRRPGQLVDSNFGTVGTVSGDTITTDTGHGFSSGDELQIVRKVPSFHTLYTFIAAAGTSGTTIKGPENFPSTISVGDYVDAIDESPVPQLPDVLHSLFWQRCAIEVMFAQREEQARNELARWEFEWSRTLSTISPRVQGESLRVVNWGSPLRSNPYRRYGGRFWG